LIVLDVLEEDLCTVLMERHALLAWLEMQVGQLQISDARAVYLEKLLTALGGHCAAASMERTKGCARSSRMASPSTSSKRTQRWPPALPKFWWHVKRVRPSRGRSRHLLSKMRSTVSERPIAEDRERLGADVRIWRMNVGGCRDRSV